MTLKHPLPLFLAVSLFAGRARGDEGPRFLKNDGHLAVIAHDGSVYDKDAGGEPNHVPRERVVQEFLATHGDFYDFVVIFTNFDFSLGDADGFYTGVRNDVSGIGIPPFDNGGRFGSASRLQGVVQMGAINHYRDGAFSVDPADPGFRNTLGIVAHEVGHRWLARARFRDGANQIRSDLLGREGTHWSYLLSSDASFMYGSRWEPVGDGTYRAAETQSRFSPLDLYLMGFNRREEVRPFTLLRNPEIDPNQFPDLGAVIQATTETISIDQVIAAEGARVPNSSISPKEFNVAFVFLTQKDIVPSAADLAAVEAVRTSFVTTFFSLMAGRAFVDTDLLGVTPPDPTALPDVPRALEWLLRQQEVLGPDAGRFQDHSLTAIRDTTVVVAALDALATGQTAVAASRRWLALQSPTSVDSLARVLDAGVPSGGALLSSLQNGDGGFGAGPRYRSDPLDTALALSALGRTGSPLSFRRQAAQYLVANQLPDGSWSARRARPGDLLATYHALVSLQAVRSELTNLDLAPSLQKALAWVVSQVHPDRGFGDGPSTPYGTAFAVEVIIEGGAPPAVIDGALSYLRQTQKPDGSWNGSVFQTAAVLKALVPASLANLAVAPSGIQLSVDPPEIGERVQVQVKVTNRARVPAGAFTVHLFNGDPEAGGQPIGQPFPIEALAAGGTAAASFEWDTRGLTGFQDLFAVVDYPAPEVSKTDNVAIRRVEVVPPLPNLVPESLTLSRDDPAQGSVVGLRVTVRNSGSVDAPASLLRFYDFPPELLLVISEVAVPAVSAGDVFTAEATWDTSRELLGERDIYAVVDAAGTVRERREDDNRVFRTAFVRAPPPLEPDLVIRSSDLTISPVRLDRIPQEVHISARFRNTGLTPAPATQVELYQGDPALGGVKLLEQRLDVPGDASVETTFAFTVTTPGTKGFFVVLDAEGKLVERDETNNVAGITLVDLEDTLDVEVLDPSLTLSATTLTAGETLVVEIDVTNRGTRTVPSLPVALFFIDEATGESVLASSTNLSLPPATTKRAHLSWKTNRIGTVALLVKADPANVLPELDEDNNDVSASVTVLDNQQANLVVASRDVELTPAPALEGKPATVSARVRNVGRTDAGPFAVSFFAGDPQKNGLSIGTASVATLAAGTEANASVSWNDVTVRGQKLLFVVVDRGNAVEEFDETDNVAIKVVEILGLPDLLAAATQLRIEPAFPRSGETVTVRAELTNAGRQDASDFTAEIRVDDPVGGTLLGTATVSLLGAGESFDFSASWDTTALSGEHLLFLVIDGGGSVREQREDNNRVSLAVALQDADLFVSPLYFSPNGDGVQDETSFFFRADGEETVQVVVLDGDQRLVRDFGDLPSNGNVTWDGRDRAGLIALDGDYYFVLRGRSGEILRRRIVLDTNRSSVVEALGTPFVSIENLTCRFPEYGDLSGPEWLPDDSAAFFIVEETDSRRPDFPLGLYRVAPGKEPQQIATGPQFQRLRFVSVRSVSPDGREALVAKRNQVQRLDLSNGQLTPLPGIDSSAEWSPDGQRILGDGGTGLRVFTRDGDLITRITDQTVGAFEWSWDGTQVIYNRRAESFLRLASVDGTNDRPIPSTSSGLLGFGSFDAMPLLAFSRDGTRVYFSLEDFGEERGVGPFELDIETDSVRLLLDLPFGASDGEISFDRRWINTGRGTIQRIDGREARPSSGRWSYRDTALVQFRQFTACKGVNGDQFALRSLLNGSADLRLARLPSGFGVRITGTAADLNLASYTLEFAPVSSPGALSAIQPPVDVPIVNDLMTTWLPPAPGDYVVKLTVRDRAGNQVSRLERVFWDLTLPIANLTRAPEYISPNGDGAQDAVVFRYSVLEPVNLEFHVRDEDGRVIRTIPRDELAVGPVSFAWDGIDDLGARVPDGTYTVEVHGAEFRVVVDTEAPVVEGTYSSLYTSSWFPFEAHLVVDLEGKVTDQNLTRWSLTTAGGDVLESGIRAVESKDDEPALILEKKPPIQGTELRALDFAGNQTIVPLSGPSREIRFLVESRTVEISPGVLSTMRQPLGGTLKPGGAPLLERRTFPPRFAFGWSVGASFPAPDLVFRYRKNGDDSFTTVSDGGRPAVFFAAGELELGRQYEGHFTAGGIRSRDVPFVVGPDAIFVLDPPDGKPYTGSALRVVLFSTFEEELVEAKLHLKINNDEKEVRVYRPFPRAGFEEFIPAAISCLDPVELWIVARGESGRVYHSTTITAYPDPRPFGLKLENCLHVETVNIEGQPECSAAAPGTATALVLGNRFPEAPESVTLAVTGPSLPVTEVGPLPPNGGSSFMANFLWNVTGLVDGNYTLTPSASLPDGREVLGKGVGLTLDNSPPELRIDSPPEGGNACVQSVDNHEYVALDVTADDMEISGFKAERLVQRNPERWEEVSLVFPPGAPPFPVESRLSERLLAEIPRGLEGEVVFRVSVTNTRISFVHAIRQEVLRSGFLVTCQTRRLRVLRSEPLGALSSDPAGDPALAPPLFSPNGDGRVDTIIIRAELLEAATVSARVLLRNQTSPIRTLVVDGSFPRATAEILWDGRDDQGRFVPEGQYNVVVEAMNGCGTRNSRQLLLEVDLTPPQAEIITPTEGQPISVGVEVVGTASDRHFKQFELEVGEGADPPAFTSVLGPNRTARFNSVLGRWDVGTLTSGVHTLRLTAEDKAGNVSSFLRRVEVRPPNLIERFSAIPALFSPNGDGVKDTVALSFRLKSESRVTLEVRSGENVVATILSDTLFPAGDQSVPWNGQGVAGTVPDGDYVAVVRAVDPVVPTLRDEASALVTVDQTPPALTIDNLTDGAFVRVPRDLEGRVEDLHLEGYRVELGIEGAALVPIEERTVPLGNRLARIPALGDGPYRLHAAATDLAGSRTDVSLGFTADATAPVISFRTPGDAAFLRKDKVPIPVTAELKEANLASFALEFGLGTPPQALVTLLKGTSVGPEGVAADWNVSEFPDGPYTLRLSAIDRAANVADASRVVTLDGTPPTVSIQEPAEGAFVTAVRPVVGTAADTHLERFLLEIAPGDLDTAFQFTEVARGATSIENSELHKGLALEDGPYTWRIRAVDRAGNESETLRAFILDTHPPAAPTGLFARVETRDDVHLEWQANTEPDLAGYFIFRGELQLTPSPIPSPAYVDPDRPEGVFTYTVKAVDRAGLVSPPSAPADAVIDLTPPFVAIRQPEDGAPVRGLVDVVGSAFSENDFKEFRLTVAAAETPESPTLLRRSPVGVLNSTLAQWDALLLTGRFLLRLEGEDLHGNVGVAEARVEVDNAPPSAPVLVSVTGLAKPDDVDVVWQPLGEPDLDGYILFRNGQVANAPGTVTGNLRPFLIRDTHFLDAGRPDGRFCYRVAAMDRAGNLGPDSNEICILLDNRAPAAVIFDPPAGAKFDKPRQVRATSADEDVARVLFQFQSAGTTAWMDIATDTATPYEALWDVSGLAFGPYLLRAVATDTNGKSDPAPATVRVILDDTTPPPTPVKLRTRTAGDDVFLTWEAVAAPDLAGYRIFRDKVASFTVGPTVTSRTDLDRPDGVYTYQVAAFDAKSNESDKSNDAVAHVYAPVLVQPFPIFEEERIDLAGRNVRPLATVRLRRVDSGAPVAETVADDQGGFSISALTLPLGVHPLAARATDSLGNESRDSQAILLVRNEPPATPQDFAATPEPSAARLTWRANTEADLSGYAVFRNETLVSPSGGIGPGGPLATTLTATASSNTEFAFLAIDGNEDLGWRPVFRIPFVPEWLEVTLNPARHLHSIEILWTDFFFFNRPPRRYRIQAELEGRLVTLLDVENNVEERVTHTWPVALRTRRVRIEVFELHPDERDLQILEVRLFGEAPVTGTTFVDAPPSGTYQYTLSAVDVYGARSVTAGPVEVPVGDLVPPDAPTNLSVAEVPEGRALDLSWTAVTDPDGISGYAVFRASLSGGPYVEVARTTESTHRDGDLTNGIEYFYVVHAIDRAGNLSTDSNEASGIPRDLVPPAAPVWFYPTTAGNPITLFQPRTDLVGFAEPASTVTVRQDGETVGSTPVESALRREWRRELGLEVTRAEAMGSKRALVAVALASEIRIYDLKAGGFRSIPESASAAGMSFSPDDEHLALIQFNPASTSQDVFVLNLATGESRAFEIPENESYPVWLSEREIAVASGKFIRVLDLVSREFRTIYTSTETYFFYWPRLLRVSRDGGFLAFQESNALSVIPTRSGDVIRVVDYVFSEHYDWTLDGMLVYADPTSSQAKPTTGVYLFNVALGIPSLIPGSEHALLPRVLPDGRISFIRRAGDSNDFLIYDPATTTIGSVGQLPFAGSALFEWSPDLRLMAIFGGEQSFGLSSFLPPGRFSLPSVRLRVGENTFVARARDQSDNEGPDSNAIEVRFDPSRLPDLSPDGAVQVIPAAPVTGQPASVFVTVRNRGVSASEATLVRATGANAAGDAYEIGTKAISGLAPGETAAVSVPWDTTGRIGLQEVTLDVDALQTVDEVDETNNRAATEVPVVGQAGIAVSVATGLPAYSAQQDAQISVQVVNGGPSRSTILDTVIEDNAGNEVAGVDSRPVQLSYGSSVSYQVFWNTGVTVAGDYRARVTVREAETQIATSIAAFTIRRTIALIARVTPGQPAYVQGEPVELLGQLTNGAGNAAFRNLAARFRVEDGAGAILFEASRPIPYLALKGSVSLSATWDSASPPPGIYPVRMDVLEGGEILVSAITTLVVNAAERVILVGSLDVTAEAFLRGPSLEVPFRVRNQSAALLQGGTVRVALADPVTGDIRSSRDLSADIGPGGELSTSLVLATGDVPFGEQALVLSAGPAGSLSSLDRERIFLYGVPTPPSRNAPAEGERTAQPLTLSVNDSASPNGLPLTYTFEIYLDAALRFQVASASGIAEGPAVTNWEVPLRLAENTRYYWRVRAADRFATSDWMSPASFFLDTTNQPPSEPTLSAPAEASEVSDLKPALEIGNAVDPEGSPLTYTFELYLDRDLTVPVIRIPSVPSGSGRTAVQVPTTLTEDQTYFWRARANDGELDGAWMLVASFRVSTANNAPSAPAPLSPVGGAFAPRRPDLVARTAVDPEGDALTYTFELDETDRFDSAALQRGEGVVPSAGDARFPVPLPLRENQVYFWRVRAKDGRATGDWSTVATFRVSEANDPPSIPTLQSPTGGTIAKSVTPALTLINATDPEAEALTYDFEVYANPALTELAASVLGIREGDAQTSWVTSPRLEEDRTYFWRARASDGSLSSAFSPSESFRIDASNSAPSAPVLHAPTDGARVTDPVVLTVENAADPEGDALTYRFELYADELLTDLVAASPEISETADRTGWAVPVALAENAVYYWRARAKDQELEGPWMATARFRFSSENEKPGTPVLLSPEDGAEVTVALPLLTVENTTDPDGDPLSYVFEVFSDAALETLVVRSPAQPEGPGTTSWQVSTTLTENGTYYWRAFASDGLLDGDPTTAFRFRVNAVHDRPSAPEPLEPPDGAEIPSTTVRLVVRNGSSPDDFALHYHFEIYRNAGLTDLVASDDDVPTGSSTTAWDVPVELEPGKTYYWRARAIDDEDLFSDWSRVFRFSVATPAPVCPPVWKEFFESFATGKAPDGWNLRVESGTPKFEIRDGRTRELTSSEKGRGALVYVGSGEAVHWRNYEFGGQVRLLDDDDDDGDHDDDDDDRDHDKDRGLARQHDDDDDEDDDDGDDDDRGDRKLGGVVFYADPIRGTEYRLEGEGPGSGSQIRIVKREGGSTRVLATVPISVTKKDFNDEPARFRIEVLNLPEETRIRARISIEKNHLEVALEAHDTDRPLREGSIGAYAGDTEIAWDDFVVRALPGHEQDSGISGDKDGDGICDDEDVCSGSIESCLDEGFDSHTGLSRWVVEARGDCGHSGESACGPPASYWVAGRSGRLTLETPHLEGGDYEFQILHSAARDRDRKNLRIVFPDDQVFDFKDPPQKDAGSFGWSERVLIRLPRGVTRFEIRSIREPKVRVEAFRLHPRCN